MFGKWALTGSLPRYLVQLPAAPVGEGHRGDGVPAGHQRSGRVVFHNLNCGTQENSSSDHLETVARWGLAAAGDVWLTVHLILPVHEPERVVPQVVALLSAGRPADSGEREFAGVIESVIVGVIGPLMPNYCCIFLAFVLSFFWRDIPHTDSTTAGLKLRVTMGVYGLFPPPVKSRVLEFFFLAAMTRAFVSLNLVSLQSIIMPRHLQGFVSGTGLGSVDRDSVSKW